MVMIHRLGETCECCSGVSTEEAVKGREFPAGTDNRTWQALKGTEGCGCNSSNGSVILWRRDRMGMDRMGAFLHLLLQ